MDRTLPATWRLPRLPPPTLGGVSYVGLVTLLGTLLLLRLALVFVNWDWADLDVYRRAASSWIEHGNPYLYDGSSGIGTYRYAPWFAGLWVLVGAVPRDVLQIAWMAGLLIPTAAIMVSLVRDHGWAGLPLALLAGGLLVSSTAGGNVQPLMVAALYFGMHRRSGPVWVGIAASLKLVPILYVIPWIGRGEWRKAAVAVAVMAVLLAPMLLFSLPATVSDPGVGAYPSMVLWAALAGGALIASVALSRGRYAWLAAGTAALLAIPRLLALDFSVILPAAKPSR